MGVLDALCFGCKNREVIMLNVLVGSKTGQGRMVHDAIETLFGGGLLDFDV